MRHQRINFDAYDYNGGVAPRPNYVWQDYAWTLPQANAEMTVFADENPLPHHIKECFGRNICIICCQKGCPFPGENKHYRNLADACKKRNMPAVRRIYAMNFAQFNRMNKNLLFNAIEKDKQKKEAAAEIKDAIKFATDFNKNVLKAFGARAEQLAQEMANQAKGKNIRNAREALKAYEKHQANINKKINARDRAAIARALESVNVKELGQNMKRFGKAFGYAGNLVDVADMTAALVSATKTNNWRPFFVKAETLGAGIAATAVTGFAFSALLGGPVGILGYRLIMAVTGALINDNLVEKANSIIGI